MNAMQRLLADRLRLEEALARLEAVCPGVGEQTARVESLVRLVAAGVPASTMDALAGAWCAGALSGPVPLRGERDRARQVAVDLEAEVARLTRIVTDAALETYKPEGAEVVVQQIGEYARRAERAERALARVRALADATHDDHYEHLIRAALDGSDQS